MDYTLLIIIALFFIGSLLAMRYLLNSRIKSFRDELKKGEDDVLTQWLRDMKGSVDKNSEILERQLKDQRDTLDQQMKAQREAISQQTKVIWERMENSAEVIRSVQKQLGGLQEFGNDMKDLSNILKSPKLRGGLGEQFLYEILENFLPKELFKTQYKFKDGNICDAVVFTEKGIIPIDSKFPMENFKAMLTAQNQDERDKFKKTFITDVKKRVDEISSKYILPAEGTTDQAVMYIPSENVYYELIVNTPEIEEYSRSKNIIMASPNTLSYFLKVLLVAFRQHELEKNVGEILKQIDGVIIEAQKFNEDLGVLERHISNSYKSMDTLKSRFGKLSTKLENLQELESPEQKPLLE
ncbi:MAG TPA: DNA recombination protein RmuC [bacterium]|nr:DNA recombination protein RmuC [bacterium]HOA18480.1 DNA recombination protein RmuC [bacterium]